MSDWIPVVSGTWPDRGQFVLATFEMEDGTYVGTCMYNGNKNQKKYITAWMPCPEPYKGESE